MRLDKFLVDCGVGSRSQVKTFLKKKHFSVSPTVFFYRWQMIYRIWRRIAFCASIHLQACCTGKDSVCALHNACIPICMRCCFIIIQQKPVQCSPLLRKIAGSCLSDRLQSSCICFQSRLHTACGAVFLSAWML